MPVITSCYLQDQVPLILSNGAVSKLRSQGLDYVLVAKSFPFSCLSSSLEFLSLEERAFSQTILCLNKFYIKINFCYPVPLTQ